MKDILLGFIATVFSASVSFCQSNNPYNELGIDVAAAYRVIEKDFEEGRLKDIDQLTLDYYFKTVLSDYPKVKLAEFSRIFNTLKGATNKSIIGNSGYSNEAKVFLNKSLTNASITALVEEVKKSQITAVEKQDVLSVLAINYHLIRPLTEKNASKTKGPSMFFETSHTDLYNTNVDKGTTLIWGAIGFITGNSICGPTCGIIGGIIGLILGGYSNDNGGGGGSSGGGGWHPQP